MREIYNLGRVVGLSSYELYVRNVLAKNPDANIMTEQEWLASTIGWGNSMILKIPAGTSAGYHDYILPVNSELCGCTLILGSLFNGKVQLDTDTGQWAVAVDNYGKLIKNVEDEHPVTPGQSTDIPVYPDPGQPYPEFADQCKNYAKITDGVVIQPGEWTVDLKVDALLTPQGEEIQTEDSETLLATTRKGGNVPVVLHPDLSKRGFIRLGFDKTIDTDFLLLLSGFTLKCAIDNNTVLTSNNNAYTNPENGDFLGPQTFPWACKIVFIGSSNIYKAVIESSVKIVGTKLVIDV